MNATRVTVALAKSIFQIAVTDANEKSLNHIV